MSLVHIAPDKKVVGKSEVLAIAEILLALLSEREPGKSVSPEEVARAADPEGWRRRLSEVRSTAVGLARRGEIVITRHGKAADPDTFKGVYRLRFPTPQDGDPM